MSIKQKINEMCIIEKKVCENEICIQRMQIYTKKTKKQEQRMKNKEIKNEKVAVQDQDFISTGSIKFKYQVSDINRSI